MSVSSKHATLVEKLYQMTEQRKLRWQKDDWEVEFKAQVSNWSVGILSGKIGTRPIIAMVLYDAEGSEIDRFTDEDLGGITPSITQHDNYYPVMGELLNAAKRSATGADQAIDSILDALDDDDL